jgi:hypothetical protein
MPRRQARRDVPRWRRGSFTGQPQVLTRRQARKYAQLIMAQAGQQQPARPAHGPVPASGLLRKSGAFRFRLQLVPFESLLATAGAGAAFHLAGAARQSVIISVLAGVAVKLLTRHASRFARRMAWVAAAGFVTWVPLLAAFGFAKPVPGVLVASWLVPAVAWAQHYSRHKLPGEEPRGTTDQDVFAQLAEKRKWAGHLAMPEALPSGGRRWRIILNGAETHIGDVLSHPRAIAAAYGKPVTQAFAEPAPDGNEARGRLTILPRNNLENDRQWNGNGIDPDTGIAVVGRFPDGSPLHERYFIPMNGVRHTIVAGADGSGKTGMLDLGLSLSATSGIIAPVIIDPQEGQALPAWRGQVPYAGGVEQCIAYLRGLHAAMRARSRYLATLTWQAEDGDERTGMGFFDAQMTGLPIVEITVDESPELLTDPLHGDEAAELLSRIGKMGRKVGFRLRLAVQVPSLAELGGLQALRSMLVGGNVFCGRTGDRVSGGMVGIESEPSELPKYFPDGSSTVGLGYASGPDNRPGTPARWDWVKDPYKVARSARIRPLDDQAAAILADYTAAATLTAGELPALAAVESDDEPAEEARSCADAVLSVLTGAGKPLVRGVIAEMAGKLARDEWRRPKPFAIKSVQNALNALTEQGRIVKVDDAPAGTYALPRPSLHAVGTGD